MPKRIRRDAGSLDVGAEAEASAAAASTDEWQPEEQQFLELFNTSEVPLKTEVRKAVDEQGWVRLNFDSGCASSVLPREWSKALTAPSNRKFKTANGAIIADEGLGVLEGINENGGRMRLAGRRAAVGKPLIAASEILKRRIGILDEGMGMVIEKNSYAGRAIMALVARPRRSG